MGKTIVIKSWVSTEVDRETKEHTERVRVSILTDGVREWAEIEDLLGQATEIINQPDLPKLIISEMSKGQFRDAIRAEVVRRDIHGNGGVDLDLVEKALLSTNRWMRRTLGTLNYTQENVLKAMEFYSI